MALDKWVPIFGNITTVLSNIKRAYANDRICPAEADLFRLFEMIDPEEVSVVIVAQDPYYSVQPNGMPIADGVAFSANGNVTPPSLRNILSEILRENQGHIFNTNKLDQWVRQGVLLMNMSIIAQEGKAKVYDYIGWQVVAKRIIEYLSNRGKPTVYLLWGNDAKLVNYFINKATPDQLVLEAVHPSGLSANRGFFGCGHFEACNNFLRSHGLAPIDWNLYKE